MSDSPYAHYAAVDPEWAALSADAPSVADALADPVAFRNGPEKQFVDFSRQLLKERFDATKFKLTDHSIPVANGTANIRVRVINPTATDDVTFPILYWIHGGGFIMGSIEFNTPFLLPLALEFQMAVALVEYRLAPENPHPAQVNDCLEGVKWIVSNASSLQIDISKGFIIGGESAGGSLAASLTHFVRDDPFFKGKQPDGQILHIPCTIDPRAYPEKYKSELRSIYITENAGITGLTRPFLEDMYAKYLQNDPSDYTASPLLWPSHENLPPALVQVVGLDLLRDEGITYEKVLREAGNNTKLFIYPGVPHGHHMMYDDMSATKKFNADFRAGLKWILSGAKDWEF